MIKISINNEKQSLNEECLLSHFLQTYEAHQQSDAPFAVAVNGEFVPRSQYSHITLKDTDTLDIVSPVGGG